MSAPQAALPNGRSWKRAGFGLAAALTALLGVALYRWRSAPFQWDRFFATLTEVDWGWLAIAICLMLLTYVGRALRWGVMLRPLRPHPNFRGICSATVIGFAAITVLGRAGELVRPYLISVKEGVPFSSQMAAWLLERILDTLVVLLIFGIALVDISGRGLHLSAGLEWVIRAGGYIIAILCGVCLLFLVVFRSFAEVAQSRILGALSFLPEVLQGRIRETMGAFSRGMESTRDRSILLALCLYTALEWLVIVAAFRAMFRAFAATRQFTWMDALIFVGFVSLGSIVQIPGIGGGVQVATLVVLTEIFGIPFEASSGLAVLIWVLSFVIVVPFGLLFAFHEGINWNKFRHLPEDIPG